MTVVQLPARVTLGCSDLAAAAGVDPYCSPVQLWLYKTGRAERRPETEAMTWGRLLEPVVAAVYAETVPVVYPAAETLTDPERPWLVGHPDGYITSDDPAVLEVKTANAWAHAANGDVPPHYHAQALGYLHLKGWHRAVIATLVAGQRLEVREVRRDDRAIRLLLDLAERFWRHVQRDEPPPPGANDRDALALLYPEHVPGRVARADRALQDRVYDLRVRRSQRDAISVQVAELENEVKAAMGDAETLIGLHDQPLATWRTVEARRFDQAEFKRQRPELYELFRFPTSTRRFEVK